jgi:LacI family transcriptional regulator
MMRGSKARQRHIVVKPVGVVTRKSTDVFAIEDRVVVDGITFIWSNAYAGIKAADVVRALAISRSGLELRFKATMGHTIHEVIRKVQLDGARDMISATNLAIKQVAANTGFKSVQHMTSLFGKAFGLTPARYRKRLISYFPVQKLHFGQA